MCFPSPDTLFSLYVVMAHSDFIDGIFTLFLACHVNREYFFSTDWGPRLLGFSSVNYDISLASALHRMESVISVVPSYFDF